MQMREFLAEALRLEKEGHRYYMRCGKETRSESAKDVFRFLAGEELEHYRRFEELHNAHLGVGPDLKWSQLDDAREGAGVFPQKEEVDPEVSHATGQLEALNIAISKEENSIKLYSDYLSREAEGGVRKLLEDIISEEQSHKKKLQDLLNQMIEGGEVY